MYWNYFQANNSCDFGTLHVKFASPLEVRKNISIVRKPQCLSEVYIFLIFRPELCDHNCF